MRLFDLIVVGAGPAGAVAATVAARAGLRVALVDKAVFPRDKLCGGALTGRALGYLRDALGHTLSDLPMRRFDDISFWAFGAPVGEFAGIPALNLTMRLDLDAVLFAQAIAAGAVDLTGEAPQHVDPHTGVVSLPQGQITGTTVLAADGVNSAVARQIFGQSFDRRTIGFALEAEVPQTHLKDGLRIDFGAAAWGYGWHFPKQEGTTIGVGGLLARNADLKTAMQRYLNGFGVSQARIKGQFLPFGAYRRRPVVGRVLFVGDAAGLVDPITGEGIAYAIRSGHMAAIAAQSGDMHTVGQTYLRQLRPIHRAIDQARLIRPFIFLPRFQQAFASSVRKSSSLRHEYLRLLDGQTEYGQITRHMLRRLPRLVAQSLSHSGR